MSFIYFFIAFQILIKVTRDTFQRFKKEKPRNNPSDPPATAKNDWKG